MAIDHGSRGDEPVNPAIHNQIAVDRTGHVLQAGMITGNIHLHGDKSRVPVPRQMPPAPAWFAGRADELARLTAALNISAAPGGTVVITAIAGAGGIGKTWLALHWAYQHVESFPDGDNTLTQAEAHRNLAKAWAQCGDDQQAYRHASNSLRLFQGIDDPMGEATALGRRDGVR